MKTLFSFLLILSVVVTFAQTDKQRQAIKIKADAIEAKVVAWRRDFHAHPELGNRETRTAQIIAKHLESLGIEVKTGVGKTGVVGVLKGALPGPVIEIGRAHV